MPFRIFIGYDSTQDIAYRVLRFSLLRHASIEIDIRPLVLPEIMARHRWHRPHDPQQSTEFTYTRFLVPYLCGFEGTALFMDSDMLCLGDIAPLAKENLSECALRVVKHDQRPTSTIKMGGKTQTSYPRKNWSSLMLMNCSKLRAWSKENVESKPASWLHRFEPLPDHQIGELPSLWNSLDAASEDTRILHYTSGGPWIEGCEDHPSAEAWWAYRDATEEFSIRQKTRLACR